MPENAWTCEACHRSFDRREHRAADIDNRGDSLEIMCLCEECKSNGYLFQYGELRVWRSSPADTPEVQAPRAKDHFNPFNINTWTKSTGSAGRSRSAALRGYYRKKRK